MKVKLSIFWFVLSLYLSTATCFAAEFVRLPTRPNITVALAISKADEALATLVILPGGAGGFGKIVNGEADGRNFLVRSALYFRAAKFNLVIMGKPSDIEDLDYKERVSEAHLTDIETVVDYAQKELKQPVWLIGTSRGTVSATAAAIAFGNQKLAGIVLTSSIVASKKIGAVPFQALDQIRIPVLVVHHENDACQFCAPSLVPSIVERLKSSPRKHLIWMRGGSEPNGDACEAYHYHGFVGIEAQTVEHINNWIRETHSLPHH